jgi:Lon protease-like protein
MVVTPQFPLGSVLFPSMVLPLHVFEPRYRVMVERVLDGDGEFGVVLIERGREVGGGDQRTDLGTMARIVDAERLSDGRWHLVTVGTERFRVNAWLPDDPYPVADVELWPDEPPTDGVLVQHAQLIPKFRRCMTLASEAGIDVGPVLKLLDEYTPGCLQMAAMAPLTPMDKHALLASPGPDQRVPLLGRFLDNAAAVLETRLTSPEADPLRAEWDDDW